MAGGLSSRFGSDKARVEVACVEDRIEGTSEPLLLALRRSLSRQGHAVEIVADRADRYDDLGVQCLVDRLIGQGPLAGVATALQHREQQRPGWLLLISCDLYVWRAEWFKSLAKMAIEHQPSPNGNAPQPVDAIAFVGDMKSDLRVEKQVWEPFPSLLHTRLLPQALTNLRREQYSLQTLFQASRTVAVKSSDNPQAWTFNTPQQLRSLRPEAGS